MNELTTVVFEKFGMVFRAEGTLDPGDPGSWDEPPEPAEFCAHYLSVNHLGKWTDAGWLLDSDMSQDIIWAATEAAQR